MLKKRIGLYEQLSPVSMEATGPGYQENKRSVFRRRSPFWTLLIFLFLSLGCGSEAPFEHLEKARLDGSYTFIPGDNPDWAISPPSGPKDAPDAQEKPYHSWHILTFTPGDHPKDLQPALLIKKAGYAHEVYFNGQAIGNKGALGDAFVEAPVYCDIYRVPENFIRHGKENQIAVRVMELRDVWNVLPPDFYWGDWRDLSLEYQRHGNSIRKFESAYIVLLGFFLVVSILLYAGGMRDSEYKALVALLFVYLTIYILDSLTFFDTGLRNSLVQRLVISMTVGMAPLITWFIYSVNREPMGRNGKVFLCFSLLVASLYLIQPSWEFFVFLDPFFHLVWIWFLVLALVLATKAWRRKRREILFFLLAVHAMLLAANLGAMGVVGGGGLSYTIILDLGFAFFLLFIGYGLVARYVRTQKHNRLLSQNIIRAHQQERTRFSRDIHDGVGQSLAALKLNIQMAAAGRGDADPRQALNQLIPEVARISGEVREMARELRPAFVEELPVDGLLERLLGKFEEQTGLEVNLEANCPGLDLDVDIKDNLFRLCQEALNNISKHSKADRVDLSLAVLGKTLEITIADNGGGFDPDMRKRQNQGIGLTSMEERAQLMGGRLRLESSPNNGCRVIIEVPLP